MADQDLTRQLLSEIERDPAVSQKRLSESLGVSVGMINWHVKRCVNKGLVKLQQAPVRRYLYYLTPDGFSEKAKLTAHYLQTSFDIFQTGREQYGALFALCQANSWIDVLLVGNTELTELALMVGARFPEIRIVGIIDSSEDQAVQGGTPVYSTIDQFLGDRQRKRIGACIACDFFVGVDKESVTAELAEKLGIDGPRFLIPGILH
jgi:DNA-binding MarR family transcriptional regulator